MAAVSRSVARESHAVRDNRTLHDIHLSLTGPRHMSFYKRRLSAQLSSGRSQTPVSALQSSIDAAPRVRALYETVLWEEVDDPRYGLIRLKVFFPATDKKDYVPEPDVNLAPYPVVVFLSAAYADALRYQWLAEHLTRTTGVCVVLFERHTKLMGDASGPSTGVEPGFHGKSPLIQRVLDKLGEMNEEGLLAGALDMSKVVFGGHSVGGSLAIMNSSSDWFPAVKGAFAYVGYCMTGPKEGHSEPSAIPVAGSVPLLLMGCSRDGVIETMGPIRYGRPWKSSMEPVRRSFRESFEPDRPGYCFEFEGMNHYAVVYPTDSTVGSSQFDHAMDIEAETAREMIAHTIELFVKEVVFEDEAAADELKKMVEEGYPMVKWAEMRS